MSISIKSRSLVQNPRSVLCKNATFASCSLIFRQKPLFRQKPVFRTIIIRLIFFRKMQICDIISLHSKHRLRIGGPTYDTSIKGRLELRGDLRFVNNDFTLFHDHGPFCSKNTSIYFGRPFLKFLLFHDNFQVET